MEDCGRQPVFGVRISNFLVNSPFQTVRTGGLEIVKVFKATFIKLQVLAYNDIEPWVLAIRLLCRLCR